MPLNYRQLGLQVGPKALTVSGFGTRNPELYEGQMGLGASTDLGGSHIRGTIIPKDGESNDKEHGT